MSALASTRSKRTITCARPSLPSLVRRTRRRSRRSGTWTIHRGRCRPRTHGRTTSISRSSKRRARRRRARATASPAAPSSTTSTRCARRLASSCVLTAPAQGRLCLRADPQRRAHGPGDDHAQLHVGVPVRHDRLGADGVLREAPPRPAHDARVDLLHVHQPAPRRRCAERHASSPVWHAARSACVGVQARM